MAQSDLNAMPVATKPVVTAQDNVAPYGPTVNDSDNAAAAQAAGVLNAAYINYDVALDAYAARADVESLAHKYDRNIPADFSDGSIMRTVDGSKGSGSAA